MTDPREPLLPSPNAQDAPPTPHIDQYSASKNRNPLAMVAVAGAVVIGIVLAAIVLNLSPTPPAASNRPPSALPKPTTPGLPFTMPNDHASTGTWEILEQTWTPSGVSIKIKVYANTGKVMYSFMAFENDSMKIVDAVPSNKKPALESGELRAGQTAEGYVFIPMRRVNGTLVLSGGPGRQTSGLPITA